MVIALDPLKWPADDGALTSDTVQVTKNGGATRVEGFWTVDNTGGTAVAMFYPQVQEVPTRTDVLENSTGYSVHIPGYDPAVALATGRGDPDFGPRGPRVIINDGMLPIPTGQRGYKTAFTTKCTQCHTHVHGTDSPSQTVPGLGNSMTR